LATPLTEGTNRTGGLLEALSAMVEKFLRSAIPLATSPSTVVVVPICRRICRRPVESSATS
jgi:hypothetical protein